LRIDEKDEKAIKLIKRMKIENINKVDKFKIKKALDMVINRISEKNKK